MTNTKNYTGSHVDWITVGVTPLPPGWVNVYRDDDGSYSTEPAPALLLEEATTHTRYWAEDDDGQSKYLKGTKDIKRQTRVVFASSEAGELIPADCANYVYSTTEAEHALRMLELEAADDSAAAS